MKIFRKGLFLLFLSSASIGVSQSSLEILTSAGISGFHDTHKTGQNRGNVGLGGEFNYSYFFKSNFGLGLGFTFYRYSGNRRYHATEVVSQVPDSEGETCDITYYRNGYLRVEREYIGLPIVMRYRWGVGKRLEFILSVGAVYHLGIRGRIRSTDEQYSRGYYPQYLLWIDEGHGFGETEKTITNRILVLRSNVSALGRFDIVVKVGASWSLLFGMRGDYGFLETVDAVGYPWAVNMEMGIRYSFAQKKKRTPSHQCHCTKN